MTAMVATQAEKIVHVAARIPPPVAAFVGRSKILRQMEATFFPGEYPISEQQRIFVLCGLGGVGKTQIALKFINENKKKSAIFVIILLSSNLPLV